MTGRTIEAPRSRYRPAAAALRTAGLATARLLAARTQRPSSQPSSHTSSHTSPQRQPRARHVRRGHGLHHIHTSTLPSLRVPVSTQVSIRYAFRHSVRISAAATTHVLKLTGRYYVPAMDAHLLAANLTHRTASIRQARARLCTIGIPPLRRVLPRFGPLLTSGSGLQPARRLIQVRVGRRRPTPPDSSAHPRLHTAQAPAPLATMPCEAFGCRLRTHVAKHMTNGASPKVAEAWRAEGWTVCDMMFRCPCAPLPPSITCVRAVRMHSGWGERTN